MNSCYITFLPLVFLIQPAECDCELIRERRGKRKQRIAWQMLCVIIIREYTLSKRIDENDVIHLWFIFIFHT